MKGKNTARIVIWERHWGNPRGFHMNMSRWTRQPRFVLGIWRDLYVFLIIRIK